MSWAILIMTAKGHMTLGKTVNGHTITEDDCQGSSEFKHSMASDSQT